MFLDDLLMILEERDDGDNNNDDNNDMETPDPVQAQIPSHPGIKYPVRGTPHFDLRLPGASLIPVLWIPESLWKVLFFQTKILFCREMTLGAPFLPGDR